MTMGGSRWRVRGTVAGGLTVLALMVVLAACGGSPSTPTPTAAPTRAPTARVVPTRTATRGTPTRTGVATPGSPRPGGTGTAAPVANPAAVTSAYAALQRLDSYRLDITANGLNALIPFGVGDTLTYQIEARGGNQRVTITDGAGGTQEAYRVAGKNYLVAAGQVTEVTALPLIFTLPDLLYTNLTAPGVTTFTAAGNERVNGRATTRYNGNGQLATLAGNPLLAAALGNVRGEIAGTIWVDSPGDFLVAGDLQVNVAAPQAGTAKLRMDVTQVGQVGPIELPR